MALHGDVRSTMIDLLEWQDPADAEPPYGRLNHLGIARLASRPAISPPTSPIWRHTASPSSATR